MPFGISGKPPPRPFGAGVVEYLAQQLLNRAKPVSFISPGIEKRVTLTDLRDGSFVELPANPETIDYTIEPEFRGMVLNSFPYVPMRYTHTKNPVINLPFTLDTAQLQGDPAYAPEDLIMNVLAFIVSLSYPAGPGRFPDPSPRANILWPKILEMDFIVRSFNWKPAAWTNGAVPMPRIVQCRLEIEEHRFIRIYEDDIKAFGFLHARTGESLDGELQQFVRLARSPRRIGAPT